MRETVPTRPPAQAAGSPDWPEQALCAQSDPEAWFPEAASRSCAAPAPAPPPPSGWQRRQASRSGSTPSRDRPSSCSGPSRNR